MQILINGLLQGILIGGVGLAFSLVYRTTGVFFVALGGVFALAPYVVLASVSAGLPVPVAVVIAICAAIVVSVVAEEAIHWPFERKRSPVEVHLIGSLGYYLVLVQVIALIWGNETRVLSAGGGSTWQLSDITLAKAQLLGPMMTLFVAIVLFIWLARAGRGLELRALADNPVLVSLMGRNIRVMRRWVFGLSGAMAAIAAIATAWDVGFDPHIGLKTVLLGMVAMIIGGAGSFAGPLIGGVLLGVLRAEVVWFGSARWEEAITFVLLGMFLFFRPQGLFARRSRLEDTV
jgi:branched-chain amino acid transport system permease protein